MGWMGSVPKSELLVSIPAAAGTKRLSVGVLFLDTDYDNDSPKTFWTLFLLFVH